MAANNFYLGLTRATANTANVGNVTAQTSANAGPAASTAADFELRIQTDTGTGDIGTTRKDAIQACYMFIEYIMSMGPDHAGTFLPKS